MQNPTGTNRQRFTPNQQTVPPVQCQPWCSHGGGHPGEFLVEDQACHTHEYLLQHGDCYDLEVFGRATPGEPAKVCLWINNPKGRPVGVYLDLSAAQYLAARLTDIVAEIV